MNPPHRIAKVVSDDGKILLDHLPFPAGQTVEVFVTPLDQSRPPALSLRGLLLEYDRPTDPVAEDDWDALS